MASRCTLRMLHVGIARSHAFTAQQRRGGACMFNLLPSEPLHQGVKMLFAHLLRRLRAVAARPGCRLRQHRLHRTVGRAALTACPAAGRRDEAPPVSGPSREAQAVPQPLSCHGDCEQAESAPWLRFGASDTSEAQCGLLLVACSGAERGDPVPAINTAWDPKFDCYAAGAGFAGRPQACSRQLEGLWCQRMTARHLCSSLRPQGCPESRSGRPTRASGVLHCLVARVEGAATAHWCLYVQSSAF